MSSCAIPKIPTIKKASSESRGLSFALPLSEMGGTTAYDRSGKIRTAFSFTNLATSDWVKYNLGYGIDFRSAGSTYLAGPTSQIITNDFSVICCVKFKTFPSNATILRSSGFSFGTGSTVLQMYQEDGGAQTSSSITLSAGVPYVLGCRWRASDTALNFFVNGRIETGLTRALSLSSTEVQVGGWTTFGFYSNATISNVRLYNRFISDAEIKASYSNPFALYRQKPATLGKAAAAGGSDKFFMFFN